MTKIFCDKCEKEINPGELGGQFTYLERNFTLDDKDSKGQVKQTTKMLCEKCVNNLKKHL